MAVPGETLGQIDASDAPLGGPLSLAEQETLRGLLLKAERQEVFDLTRAEIDLLMGQIQVAQDTTGTLRDWESMTWTGSLFEIFSRLREGKNVTFRDVISVIERNSRLIYYFGSDFLKSRLPASIAGIFRDVTPEVRQNIQSEITNFVSENSALFDRGFTVLELKRILREVEIIFIYLGRVPYEGSDASTRGGPVNLHRVISALHTLHFNETTSPLVKKFIDAYIGQKFPVMRQTIENNRAVAARVAPPYHTLFTNPQVLDSFMGIFETPQRLTDFFMRTSEKLDEIKYIINTPSIPPDYRPTRFKWTARGRRDAWKQEMIKQGFQEIMQDFLGVFGPLLVSIQGFLREHPETWRYFLQNGTRLHERQSGETGQGLLTPDSILKVFFGQIHGISLSIDNLTSEEFFNHVLRNPEVMGGMMTGFFLEVYGLWSQADNSREIRDTLARQRVVFGPFRFRNALRIAIDGNNAPEIQRRIDEFREMMRILGTPNVTWEAIQVQGNILFRPRTR